MFMKEIKKVSKKSEWRIHLAKKDGNIHEGKCYILYPEELEEIQKDNKNIQQLQEEIQSLKTQLNTQTIEYEDMKNTIKQLEEEHTKKDDEIQQLQREKDDLNYSVDGLNSTISSMKIKHDEEIKDVTSKYNKSVDLIHSLITTTSLIKNEISNLGIIERTLHHKKNINSIYNERGMDILIKQQLIQKDCIIPEKIMDKE